MSEQATPAKVTPETIAQKAAEIEDDEDKSGGAKHFDQPGVRFSIPELREQELARKTATGISFRQHVEEGLLLLRAIRDLNTAKQAEFIKKIKDKATDFDKDPANKCKEEDLFKWLESVQSGARTGGGAAAAAKAREEALRKEIDELKAKLAAKTAGAATK